MRALLAWIAFTAGALFVVIDIVRLSITGLAVLGVVLLVFWLWGIGGFTASFWRLPDSAGGAFPDSTRPSVDAPSAGPQQ
jgi:hypothetical protein